MTYLSNLKISRSSAEIAIFQCCFHPFGRRKITNLTIFASSSSSNSASSSTSDNGTEKTLKNEKQLQGTHSVAQNERKITSWGDADSVASRSPACRVSNMVEKSCGGNRKWPFWRKLIFGSKKFRSMILLNAVALVSASDITVIKEVEAFTNPAYFCAVRFAVSTIPFLPFIFKARNDVQIRNSGFELGLWVSLGYMCEALGLLTSDAGHASFISLFTVIVIPLLESMFGAIVPARTWFGIFMSVVGIAMFECSGSPPNIGDLFNFLSAIFFGIHTLRTEHISRTTRKENLFGLLGYEVGVVAVMSTIWWLIGDCIQDSDGASWTWAMFWDGILAFPWIPALYTGVFSTGLCLWGEISAMRDVSATETAVIYGLEPLWGASFAWFLLGERWGAAGWMGAALILGGSLTVQIFGASAGKSREASKRDNSNPLMVSDHKKIPNSLSTSPVVIRSQDNVIK
ncbi:uncharacterized protein LOC111401417 [Olea europaea subsp. europaea]|uniref:Uncharacterized protein LOC111401417 n=1 Tax=Olea europaea subsp. europaea TaxID=158383 RepID=A0A8S0VCL9_OLEEU|nr:uncharacterized protein LOC111401417 [Olea europaea subsp. europaea]